MVALMSKPGRKPKPSCKLTSEQEALVNRYYPDLPNLIGHQRLYFLTKKFTSWDDAVQAAALGLIRAAQLFDPKRGNQFLTFAYFHMMAALQRGLCSGGHVNLIRVPQYYKGPRPQCNLLSVVDQSLESATTEIDNFRSVESTIVDHRSSEMEMAESQEQVERLEGFFNEREKAIIGLYVIERWTLQEIGHLYGLSKERIRQIVHTALSRARRHLQETGPGNGRRALDGVRRPGLFSLGGK